MIRTGILLLMVGLMGSMYAQKSEREVIGLSAVLTQEVLIQKGVLPYANRLPFYTYFLEWSEGQASIAMRFSKDNINWTNWDVLEQDSHNHVKGITQMYVGHSEHHYYQVRIQANSAIDDIKLHFYYPGKHESTTNDFSLESQSVSCACPQPEILERSDWCPAGDCAEHPSPSSTSVTHLIVHHSAGVNTANDWSAIVRAIWDFHVNGNGWSDVGYNWLIDPNGVIYEGRGDDILGAHFCGSNTGTMGVCMMGNFTDVEPTDEAVTALEQLLAWKSCDIDADPEGESFHASTGRTLHHISGHRDGCATACPGEMFYPMFDDIRTDVAEYISLSCEALVEVSNIITNNEIVLSPNPVQNELKISFDTSAKGEVRIRVFDMMQHCLMDEKMNKWDSKWSEQMLVGALSPGIYIVEIHVGEQRWIQKMIKS